MDSKLVIFLYLTTLNVYGSDLIIDYFNYKKTSSVIGYSCNNIRDISMMLKDFSESGIASAINEFDDNVKFHLLAKSTFWKVGVFLDFRYCDYENSTSLFQEASEYRMYDESYHWLVVVFYLSDVLKIIDDRAFGITTDFVIAVRSNSTDGYDLYEIFNSSKKHGGTLVVTFVGHWSSRTGLQINMNRSTYERRANLNGMTLKAMFFVDETKPPEIALENYFQDFSSAIDGLSKFGYIITSHLSDMYNFRIQYIAAPRWEVGDPDGPIMRALYNEEIDITGSPATMNIKRTYMVKYVHQSRPFRSCFVFRSPQPKTIKINEILGPLEIEVWYLNAAFFIGIVCIMRFLFRFENNSNNILMQYSDSLVVIFSAICQQGTDMKMKQLSSRIAFLCILSFYFLLYNYYSASIVSTRLNEPIFKINDSLAELAKINFRYASEWMIYFDFFIKKKDWETETFYNTQWVHVPENERFMDPETSIKLVQQGGFAYHVQPDIGYPLINQWFSNRELCELTEVHLAKPTFSTFAVTFNSSFVEMMKIGLDKISEAGLRKRQVDRWKAQKPECQTSVLSASSINMYEFAPHLLILLIGIVLAIFICVVEIAETTYKQYKKAIKNN